MKPIRHIYLPAAVLPILLMASLPASASVFDVGSTDTTHRFKIKAEYEFKRTDLKLTRTAPKFSFGGPLAANVEFSIGSGYTTIDPRYAPRHTGFNDLEFEIKWRFLDADPHGSRPSMALAPEISFPSGSHAKGIGKAGATLKLPLRASKSFGRLSVLGQVVYKHGFAQSSNQLGAGVLVEYALTPRFTIGAETLDDAPSGHWAQSDWRANIGFKWKPSTHWRVEGLVGHSLDNRRGEPATKAKFMLEYKFQA